MLKKGEDEGGVSMGEGKPAEQVRFFSAEVCGTVSHLRSVTVVEFGSRPVKRARLLSDTDDPVKEAQISRFERRGLARGDSLERSNGDLGGMSQANQGEEPISESSSIVANGFHLRSAVAGPILASGYMQNGLNTRAVPEQKPGAQEDEKRSLPNHGNINGKPGCMIHSMQEDVDDTTSTSGDEGLFVVRVRSPTTRQLAHASKHGSKSVQAGDAENITLDAEKVENGVANVKLVGADSKLHICRDTKDELVKIQAPRLRSEDANGLIDNQQSDGSPRRRNEAQHTENADAIQYDNKGSTDDAERVEYSTPQVHESVPSNMENSEKVIQEASVGVSGAGVKSSEILNVYLRKRKRSTPAEIATVGSVPLQDYGSSQSEDLAGERVIKQYVRRPHRQTDSHSSANMIEKPSEHVMTSSSSGGKEVVNPLLAEHHIDTSASVEPEGNFNVFQRRSRMRQLSQAEVSTPKADVARVESEGNLNVFQRRSKMNKLPQAENHAEVSSRVESEGNLNVFQRRSQMNHTSQAEHHEDVSNAAMASVESEGNLNVFQRRPTKSKISEGEHHEDTSARVESEGNLNVFQRRSKSNHLSPAEHHADVAEGEREENLHVFQRRSKKNQLPEAEHNVDVPARVEAEGNLNVFQRRSKKKLSQKEPSKNDIIGLKEVNEKHAPAGYVRADHQPNWLPEGWTLEIREGKTTAHPRDKYYHDNKSGRIFRSKNEVLQFLVDGRVGGVQMMSNGSSMKALSQNKNRPPVPTAPAKQTGFHSPLFKSSVSTQIGLIPQAAPSPAFTHMHPARMKTTPMTPTSAVSSERNETGMTWAHITGSKGAIWIPWDGAIGTGNGEQYQGDTPGKDAGAIGLHGGAANSSQLLSSGDGTQLPHESPVSTVKPPSEQGEKENRGKLIFRLKRKHPDSEGGKGRSKRPMYEVVHVEKASSSTSTPPNQEKLTTGERTGQDVPQTPGSVQMRSPRISSMKESPSPNVVSGSMPVKAQVENHIPVEKPSFTSPSPLVMPLVDHTPEQSVASFKVTSDSISLEHPVTSNWGIKLNPLQHPQHLELLQQEPYTALGIPATARYSGLQQMASYSANHTHVFLDPVDNTIPLSWQYPFTVQASTSVTASVPFSVGFTPPVSKTFSSTVPIPAAEPYPGVSSLTATATTFPCPEPVVDSRTRDSASNPKLAEGGLQVQKAPKGPKPLTKADHTKLFLDLGRRLCLTGVEQKTRNLKSVGTLKPLLQSQTPVANLELQQGVLQTTPRMQ